MEKINLSPDWVFSPQPMYISGTKNEDGSPNFCIITWLGFSYDNGPCMMMTVGGTKLTQKNILREKRFSANMITEDNLWLADYFGNTNGENGQKNEIPYSYEWGKKVDVPIINECHWSYECEVSRVVELNGAHLYLAAIKNIQIDKQFENMNMKKIDLEQIHPVIYAPYNYFSIGNKLGEMGDWQKHFNKDVYEFCPMFENQKYVLRPVDEKDLKDLHKVYSDKNAVPFFNVDNCHGDDFYYETIERMKQAIDFWSFSYKNRYFVRWTIFDKSVGHGVGTIELFHRDSEKDFFNNCGLLRLDLRSDYEKSTEIENILSLIIPKAFDLFDCGKIATKCWKNARERKIALEKFGFSSTSHKLIGESEEYDNYFVLEITEKND